MLKQRPAKRTIQTIVDFLRTTVHLATQASWLLCPSVNRESIARVVMDRPRCGIRVTIQAIGEFSALIDSKIHRTPGV